MNAKDVANAVADAMSAAGEEPLLPEDRPRWAAARTLQDLADLTALWLAGEIRSQPGYYGPVDVDEDLAPGMTDCLIMLNRIGFLTCGSQAEFDGTGFDRARWVQRAAVDGFCDNNTLHWLYRSGIASVRASRAGWPARWAPGEPVTWRDGVEVMWFGGHLDPGDIDDMYVGISDEAYEALCAAWHVTVMADGPLTGATLWERLRVAALNRKDALPLK